MVTEGAMRARGMTLIELLVVMVILSILVSAVAAVWLHASGTGPIEAAKADIQKISLALDEYKLQFRCYPPDTGFGLDMTASPGTYDPGSLWRYLVKPVYDPRTGKLYGPYLEWEQDRLKEYMDRFHGRSFYLVDPWGNPYGFVGDKRRVMHNQGSFDLFSCGPDGVTACNNGIDDPEDNPDGWGDPSTNDPLSTRQGDNRAYNNKDDDGNGFVDDSLEFGPEASLNGDVGDDINNWSSRE